MKEENEEGRERMLPRMRRGREGEKQMEKRRRKEEGRDKEREQ